MTVQPARRYLPDLALALLVLLVGVLEVAARRYGAPTLLEVVTRGRGLTGWDSRFDVLGLGDLLRALGFGVSVTGLFLAVAAAAASALARHHGGAALAVVWLSGAVQLVLGGDIVVAQLSIVYVTFALACWGGPAVLVASAVSVPVGALFVSTHALDKMGVGPDFLPWRDAWSDLVQSYLLAAPMVMLILGVPWLVGLAMRATRRARVSQQARLEAEAEAARSDEIAALRAQQARLAHDVHDVVGHSLAVILAQAESAQFLDPAEQDRIRDTLANIAATSRQSLSDVRTVLAGADEPSDATAGVRTELNDLVEGVRSSGNTVELSVAGQPRPLPPELQVVAYRTLQEMLTNALKHGRRGEPVEVEQRWGAELHLRVANPVVGAPAHGDGPGLGQLGMARRVESVGGRLAFGKDIVDGEERYVAQAWLPVRAARTP